MLPPEPVDITADCDVLIEPDPPPYVVDEMPQFAGQAKNEPSFSLLVFVVELIWNQPLMGRVAPHYDARELRERYPEPIPKFAA